MGDPTGSTPASATETTASSSSSGTQVDSGDIERGIPRAQLLVRTEFIRNRLAERRRKDPLGYSEEDYKLDNARIDTVVGYCFYEAFSRPLEEIMGNIRITHPLENYVALSKLEPINLRLYYLDFMASTYLSVEGL